MYDTIGMDDDAMKQLIDAADEAGMPLANRVIRIPGYLGTLYGCKVVADPNITTPHIEVERKRSIRMSLRKGEREMTIEEINDVSRL